jgi:hypothetical protein
MPNLIRLMMASNNEWVIGAGNEARRYLVLDVSEAKMQDKAYFAAIVEQLDQGGREAMMHDLMRLDLKNFDLRTIPQTKALLDQKLLSMSDIQKFWYNRLREGEPLPGKTWGDWVPCSELYALYVKEATQQGEKRRLPDFQFGRQLSKNCPDLIRQKRTLSVSVRSEYTGMDTTRDAKIWAYQFPTLATCRASFAAQFQTPLDWDDESDDSSVHAPSTGASQPLLQQSTDESPF